MGGLLLWGTGWNPPEFFHFAFSKILLGGVSPPKTVLETISTIYEIKKGFGYYFIVRSCSIENIFIGIISKYSRHKINPDSLAESLIMSLSRNIFHTKRSF